MDIVKWILLNSITQDYEWVFYFIVSNIFIALMVSMMVFILKDDEVLGRNFLFLFFQVFRVMSGKQELATIMLINSKLPKWPSNVAKWCLPNFSQRMLCVCMLYVCEASYSTRINQNSQRLRSGGTAGNGEKFTTLLRNSLRGLCRLWNKPSSMFDVNSCFMSLKWLDGMS